MDKIEQLARELLEEIEERKCEAVVQDVKEAHPRRYVTEIGEVYVCIISTGELSCAVWDNDNIDKARLEMGNVYRTKEEAQKVVNRKKLIQELWQEDGVLLEPDWGDENQLKYYLYYSYYLAKWVKSNHMLVQSQFELPHFESKEAVEAVIEKYGSRLDVLL